MTPDLTCPVIPAVDAIATLLLQSHKERLIVVVAFEKRTPDLEVRESLLDDEFGYAVLLFSAAVGVLLSFLQIMHAPAIVAMAMCPPLSCKPSRGLLVTPWVVCRRRRRRP